MTGDTATIDVALDRKPLLHWSGPTSSLSYRPAWRIPDKSRSGLGSHMNEVEFSKAQIRLISGKASLLPSAISSAP